jgi:hypothetical protein
MKRTKKKSKKIIVQEALPENWKEYSVADKRVYKTYGLSKEQHAENIRLARNKCQICETDKALNIDHIHIKNFKKLPLTKKEVYVRGILCFRCNKYLVGMIDRYKNSGVVLEGIKNYFEVFPTKYQMIEYENSVSGTGVVTKRSCE